MAGAWHALCHVVCEQAMEHRAEQTGGTEQETARWRLVWCKSAAVFCLWRRRWSPRLWTWCMSEHYLLYTPNSFYIAVVTVVHTVTVWYHILLFWLTGLRTIWTAIFRLYVMSVQRHERNVIKTLVHFMCILNLNFVVTCTREMVV